MSTPLRQQMIDDLSRKLRRWERFGVKRGRSERIVSTGIPPLDALLPEGGVPPGTIIECLSAATGSGSETLAMIVAGHVMGEQGVCVVIDRSGSFYPPAATLWVQELGRMLVVHPQSDRDAVWALEQSLRCSGVAVVVCRLEKLSQQAWRRLQLAGETGGGIGLVLRSAEQREGPSWAGVRLLVKPLPVGGIDREVSVVGEQEWSPGRRMRIELIHCRGRTQEGSVELEIDDETGDVHLAPAVAPAAHRLRALSRNNFHTPLSLRERGQG